MSVKIKILFRNVISLVIFFLVLGKILDLLNFTHSEFQWMHWFSGGVFAGIFLFFLGLFLESWTRFKRVSWNKDLPSFLKQSVEVIKNSPEGILANYKSYPVFFTFNILPVKKIPRKGLQIGISFKPILSDTLYEIKKRLSVSPLMQADNFYLLYFLPDMEESNGKALSKVLDQAIQTLNHFQLSPDPGQCMNCHQKNKQIKLIAFNDIPVYICPDCEKKLK